jgi:hypothetical protein
MRWTEHTAFPLRAGRGDGLRLTHAWLIWALLLTGNRLTSLRSHDTDKKAPSSGELSSMTVPKKWRFKDQPELPTQKLVMGTECLVATEGLADRPGEGKV